VFLMAASDARKIGLRKPVSGIFVMAGGALGAGARRFDLDEHEPGPATLVAGKIFNSSQVPAEQSFVKSGFCRTLIPEILIKIKRISFGLGALGHISQAQIFETERRTSTFHRLHDQMIRDPVGDCRP
jgi:hypothetical protein